MHFLSFSVFIAGVIGFIRYRSINKIYYPFLICLWLACVNESISFLLAKNQNTTIINNNIYVLLESLLITLFFKNIGLFKTRISTYYLISFSFIIVWAIEVILIRKFHSYNVYFSIFYSMIIVLMSISTINGLIGNSKKILRNSIFLLCVGFIVYFTFMVLTYAFWIYGLNSSNHFLNSVFRILVYINLFVNLIYALAVLWMPKKQVFTMPS